MKHYATRKRSDRERQILYDLNYMWNLKTQTQIQRTDRWLPEAGEREAGGTSEGDPPQDSQLSIGPPAHAAGQLLEPTGT